MTLQETTKVRHPRYLRNWIWLHTVGFHLSLQHPEIRRKYLSGMNTEK